MSGELVRTAINGQRTTDNGLRDGIRGLSRLVSCFSALMLIFLLTSTCRADIYKYVDNKGVVHFSNVPTKPGFQVYIKENRAGRVRVRRVPTDYDGYISEASRKHGISPSLIRSVIRAESNFDPYAVSKKGARGLMQLMPETAKDLGVDDSFDPRQNILGGTKYLKDLLKQFDGRLPLALAAYNAGPKVVQSRNRVPNIEETQVFVSRVMGFLREYQLD